MCQRTNNAQTQESIPQRIQQQPLFTSVQSRKASQNAFGLKIITFILHLQLYIN